MNERKRRFVDAYFLDPCATRAAEAAGYSPKTAYSIGQRLLRNVEILGAIAERNKDIESSRIANLEECLTLLTRIARGELMTPRTIGGEIVQIPPTFAERLRACEIRLKTLGAFVERSDNREALDKLDEVLEKISGAI